MRKLARPVAAVAALVLAGLAGALLWRWFPGDGDDPELVALGARVYAERCASCHGAALEGQPDWQRPGRDGVLPAPPHDATGHTWHHADRVLLAIVGDGGAAAAPPGFKSGMPGFAGTLSEQDIGAAIAYIKSRWPPDIRAHQARVSAGGG